MPQVQFERRIYPPVMPTEFPTSCQTCSVRKLTPYGHFSDAALDKEPFASRTFASFRAGQTIFRQGERPQVLYTILNGWALRAVHLSDGGRQILSFLLPGDMAVCSAFSQKPLEFWVKSITPVTACALQREVALQAWHGAPLDDFARTLDVRWREMRSDDERITDLGRRSAVERVARFLLDIETRLQRKGLASEGRFNFPLRQEHLADALGLTPQHVNRTLTSLRSQGLISYGDSEMHIVDRVALEKIVK